MTTPSEFDETRATARLPNLDIDILHRRAWEGDFEQLQITLSAAPSFEAFGRALEAGTPMQLWMRIAQAAWAPWMAMLGMTAIPDPARLDAPKRDG